MKIKYIDFLPFKNKTKDCQRMWLLGELLRLQMWAKNVSGEAINMDLCLNFIYMYEWTWNTVLNVYVCLNLWAFQHCRKGSLCKPEAWDLEIDEPIVVGLSLEIKRVSITAEPWQPLSSLELPLSQAGLKGHASHSPECGHPGLGCAKNVRHTLTIRDRKATSLKMSWKFFLTCWDSNILIG